MLINGTHSHQADILNRIAVKVTDVRDGSGLHDAVFQTSERAYGSSGSYEWSEDYDSVFWRDARGAFDIEDRYFMPVVRNVPLFPEKPVSPGDTWSARGMGGARLPGELRHPGSLSRSRSPCPTPTSGTRCGTASTAR